jgi:hypothetical protein
MQAREGFFFKILQLERRKCYRRRTARLRSLHPPRGTGNHGHLPRAATTTPSHHAHYAPAARAAQETLLIAPAAFHFPSSLQSPRPASRRCDSRPDRSAYAPLFSIDAERERKKKRSWRKEKGGWRKQASNDVGHLVLEDDLDRTAATSFDFALFC